MPSVSKKQHNLMALVANNPKAAKRLGIKQSVGEDFMKADKGKKFAKGGCATKADAKSIAKKEVKGHEKSMHAMKKGGVTEKGTGKYSLDLAPGRYIFKTEADGYITITEEIPVLGKATFKENIAKDITMVEGANPPPPPAGTKPGTPVKPK